NGARCIARFVAARGRAVESRDVRLASVAGPIDARVLAAGEVSVNLGVPNFSPASLPFRADAERDKYVVHVAGRDVEIGAVSMGNPHAVLLVDSVETADVGILGAELATHAAFPRGVNVEFLEIVRPDRVRVR